MSGPPRMLSLDNWMQNAGISLAPDSARLVDNIFKLMTAEGKPAASKQYGKVLARFLAFAESNGHSLNSLPPNLPADWIAMEYPDSSPSTRDVTRSALRSAVNRATAELGVDLSHLQIEAREVPKKSPYRVGEEKAAKDLIIRAHAAAALEENGIAVPAGVPRFQGETPPLEDPKTTYFNDRVVKPATLGGLKPIEAPPPPSDPIPEAALMPENISESSPAPEVPVSDFPPQQQPQVIVLQQPPAPRKPPVTSGIANPSPSGVAAQQQGAVQLVVNGVPFREPFVGIYRIMDGTLPGTQAGQEVMVETAVTRAVANYGTADSYIQRTTLAKIRAQIVPGTSVVTFALVGMNAAKQPTNTRAEVTVAVVDQQHQEQGTPPMPSYLPSGFQSLPAPAAPEKEIYLRGLEEQRRESQIREEKAREEAKKATDVTMQFMLQQQAQREADLRRELEQKQREAEERNAKAMNFSPFNNPGFFPPPPLPPQEGLNLAEVLKAQADSTRELLAGLHRDPPPPPPPDRTMETVMMPLITMMQQQSAENAKLIASQQQAAQAQMLQMQQDSQRRSDETTKLMLQMQQESTKQMMALLTQKEPESETDKLIKTMMMKKLTDDESGIDKMAKSFMAVRNMAEGMGMGGGGGGGTIVQDLIGQLPGILSGFARVQQANAMSAQAQKRPVAVAPQVPAHQAQRQEIPETVTPAPNASSHEVDPAANVDPSANGGVPAAPPAGATATEPVVMANPGLAVPDELRQATIAMIGMARDEDDSGDMGFIAALQNYIPLLSAFNAEFANNLLNEFKRAGGYEDIYAVAKYALRFGGLVDDRENIVAVAEALHRQYSTIYPVLSNGENKLLPDADMWDESEDDEDGFNGEDDEEEETGAAA